MDTCTYTSENFNQHVRTTSRVYFDEKSFSENFEAPTTAGRIPHYYYYYEYICVYINYIKYVGILKSGDVHILNPPSSHVKKKQ